MFYLFLNNHKPKEKNNMILPGKKNINHNFSTLQKNFIVSNTINTLKPKMILNTIQKWKKNSKIYLDFPQKNTPHPLGIKNVNAPSGTTLLTLENLINKNTLSLEDKMFLLEMNRPDNDLIKFAETNIFKNLCKNDIYKIYLENCTKNDLIIDDLKNLEKIGIRNNLKNWNLKNNLEKKTKAKEPKKPLPTKIGTSSKKCDFPTLSDCKNKITHFINQSDINKCRKLKIKKFYEDNETPEYEQKFKKICNSKWCKFDIHFNEFCPWFGNYSESPSNTNNTINDLNKNQTPLTHKKSEHETKFIQNIPTKKIIDRPNDQSNLENKTFPDNISPLVTLPKLSKKKSKKFKATSKYLLRKKQKKN